MEFTAEQYINDVRSGKVIACDYIHKAMDRHDRDLVEKKDFYFFDDSYAKVVIEFFSYLNHYKGKWAGKPLLLTPHQQWCYYLLFGWRRKSDGLRRFRTYYKEEARKNGKTAEAGAIGLYMMKMDDENAAEVYTIATKEDQARICFDSAKNMYKSSSILKNELNDTVKRIYDISSAAYMSPLGSDSKRNDGFNPHCGIIDEYHEHKDDSMLNVLESGMGAREQPLIYIITTAGFNINGPCYKLRKIAVSILNGQTEDDTFLPIICTLDKEDDWNDPKNWVKANPLLGESVNMDFLMQRYKKAKNEGGTKEVDFKTKNLNIWTQSSDTWVQDHIWMRNSHGFDKDDLIGKTCYGGLDLGHSVDLNAFTLFFPDAFELKYKKVHGVLRYIWIPEAKVDQYKDDADWLNWVSNDLVFMTKGDFVDHEFITHKIDELRRIYNIKSIAIDPYIARHYVVKVLQDYGITFTELRQGFLSLSNPTKELETLITKGDLEHFNDPVLRWMVSNCEVVRDAAGNIKLTKQNNIGANKIDGVAALVNSIAEWITPGIYQENVIEIW